MHRESKNDRPANRTPAPENEGRTRENDPRSASEAIHTPSAEHRRTIAELRKKMESVLSGEQKHLRDAAKKKAIKEGKKGPALRAAADAAANLTDEQKKQFQDLREDLGKLIRASRGK